MILATNLKRISLWPTANISLLATNHRMCNKEFVLRYYTMMCEAMGMNPEGFLFFPVNDCTATFIHWCLMTMKMKPLPNIHFAYHHVYSFS